MTEESKLLDIKVAGGGGTVIGTLVSDHGKRVWGSCNGCHFAEKFLKKYCSYVAKVITLARNNLAVFTILGIG